MEVAEEQMRLIREAIAAAKQSNDLTTLADLKTTELNFVGFMDKFRRDIQGQIDVAAHNATRRNARLSVQPNARSPTRAFCWWGASFTLKRV